MKKRIISSIMSVMLAVSMVVPAFAAEQQDIVIADDAVVLAADENEQISDDEAVIVDEVVNEESCDEIVFEEADVDEDIATEDSQLSDTSDEYVADDVMSEAVAECEGSSSENTFTLLDEISGINPLYEGLLDEEYEDAKYGSLAETKSSLAEEASIPRDETIYRSKEAAAKYLRKQMVNRKGTVTIYLNRNYGMQQVFDAAIAHGKKTTGQEGDALKWGWKYRRGTAYVNGYGTMYKYVYYLEYYTSASQEKKLTSAVNKQLKKMDLKGKSDYYKIRKIYDYICDHVDYDYAHVSNKYYYKQYTAYAAMCEGKAVCQGYAVLFYRMCLDAGVQNRVITSYNHAWNIVKIGKKYYSVDSTWDGQDKKTTHDYFLKGSKSKKFKDTAHKREAEYTTKAFNKSYPMASKDYKWK